MLSTGALSLSHTRGYQLLLASDLQVRGGTRSAGSKLESIERSWDARVSQAFLLGGSSLGGVLPPQLLLVVERQRLVILHQETQTLSSAEPNPSSALQAEFAP